MFATSTQKKFWMFADESELTALREKTNVAFIDRYGRNMTVKMALLLFNFHY